MHITFERCAGSLLCYFLSELKCVTAKMTKRLLVLVLIMHSIKISYENHKH